MNDIVLSGQYTSAIASMTDSTLTEEILQNRESIKSQSAKIQALKFLDFGLRVTAKSMPYIAKKFVIPANTVQIVEPAFDSKTGKPKPDNVYFQVPDCRMISFNEILAQTPAGRQYLENSELTLSKAEFQSMAEIIKAAEKVHKENTKDVKLLQKFEQAKKLFRSEIYLDLSKMKAKFLRNEATTRQKAEVNAAAIRVSERLASMQKTFSKMMK